MKTDSGWIRQWFGYSRRERRASFILIILIVVVTSLRYIVPERKIPVEILSLVSEDVKADTPVVQQTGGYRISGYSKHSVQKKERWTLELNSCDTSDLARLPGIGKVLSSRIIKYRNLLGGYVSREQLLEVYGLSRETYDIIRDKVKADSTLAEKIDINSCDYERLSKLPYFSREELKAVFKYRELNGRIDSVGELIENKVIASETGRKVRPYLKFDQ